ncbi:PD-(D/E)XK nuclease-like domain-containing protein [Rufibacter latericius]|uniref:Putative exodeoxyribonuclease 8 PDDEXK-like domain-containing protein n=1 Tax=Rufibacter latericius TaxID=2487040 RepID=A0A3M9MM27_9BACT|nr:PD-(D/E)XK nuclease-like domain-containing protein [Rufibacter latericius]RNI26594.1 hypothetical protein EFB08_11285 [Rufibacter latericius]
MQVAETIAEKALIQKDSNSTYHSKKEYINASGLKTIFQKSPMHFANSEAKEPTPAMLFGTAYHDFVLEEDLFHSKYWTLDMSQRPENDKTMASNKNKAWKEEMELLNADRQLIGHDDLAKLQTMKKVLLSNPTIAGFLINGEAELSHYHQDFNGAAVRVRPDYLKPKVIVDLKTCQDASPEGFARQAHGFGYHIQAALYSDVLEDIYGTQRKFVFICQETTFPYAAQAYAVSENFLNQGRYEYSIALELYKKCQQTGEWPGYEIQALPEMRGLIELDLPVYAYRESKLSA